LPANAGLTGSSTPPAASLPATVAASPLPTAPVAVSATVSASAAGSQFDGQSAFQIVLDQVAIGPRPTGSAAGWKTGEYIIEQLHTAGWQVETQEFTYRGVRARNVIATAGHGPVVIVGAHYDTRPAADQDPDPANRQKPILGADDGGSGVAVLLELARVLNVDQLKESVWLAFFDAEDRGGLDGWPFSVGAAHMAGTLKVKPQAVIVVDMVGDKDQKIYFEHNSNLELMIEIWSVADRLGYGDHFIPEYKYTMTDDHIPFVQDGFPAVDLIDFEYPFWHTLADTSDKISPASLERVGRTLQVWLEGR